MTYQDAKAMRDKLDEEVRRLSAALHRFPKGPIGLTPDAVKTLPEYRSAKTAYDAAFQRLRAFNATFTKMYKREIQEERACRQVETAAARFVADAVARYGAASALSRARTITHEYPANRQPQWLTRSIELLDTLNEGETK